MNSTAVAAASVNFEPLPGYLVTERIGSGGYGEVFKATAPGGVEKAVKSLYGYHDEELASRELKALERIKRLRHPFLLSLDRFEIVDGRLIVVTELADGSLDDCFQQYRRQGQVGIPRNELLLYLRDAADALDYMQHEHGLQHLDVKPENLLVVGSHVKVADFGLVKDIARASQNSMVGGMTPTYAAPELFDNRPGPRTDQYSLAIVYQELLTGMLPFPGRTAAQLVAQHTQSAPRVSALPDHDQPLIQRALSKDPQDRYPSCIALVKALMGATGDAGGMVSSAADATSWEKKEAVNDDTKEVSACVTEQLPNDSAPKRRRTDREAATESGLPDQLPATKFADRWAPTEPTPGSATGWSGDSRGISDSAAVKKPDEVVPEIKVRANVVDAPGPDIAGFTPSMRPTLLIALGGQAGGVLRRVRQNLLAQDSETDWQQLVPMLLLDADRDALRCFDASVDNDGPAAIDTHLMPLKLPQHYRERSSEILQWLSRRWFYNIPRSLETGGFRPLGRLALIDNAESVIRRVAGMLERLTDREQLASISSSLDVACRVDEPRVIIVASTSGGVGSGTALDVAQAIRNAVEAETVGDVELVGVFGDCGSRRTEERDLSLANSLAFLREFSSIARQGNRSRDIHHEQTALFEGDCLPLDHAYYVSSYRADAPLSVEKWIEQTADYLTADIASGCGPLIEACRAAPVSDRAAAELSDAVRSFVVAPLDEQRDVVLQLARKNLCEMVAKHWRTTSPDAKNSGNGATGDSTNQQATAGADPPVADSSRRRRWGAKPPPDDGGLMSYLAAEIQGEFGAASDSVFVKQLLETLRDKMPTIVEKLQQHSDPAAGKYLHSLVHLAFKELTNVVCQFAAGPDGDAMSARCLKGSLKAPDTGNHCDDVSPEEASQSALTAEIAREACNHFFTVLVEGRKQRDLGLAEFLQKVVARAVDELSGAKEGEQIIERLANCKPDLRLAIKNAVVGPPDCGHVRRVLVILPENDVERNLEDDVKQLVPTATVAHGKVARPVLIGEISDLSVAQVAAELADDRPDLVKASRRLHARNDLAWLPLPRVDRDDAEA